MQPVVLTSLIEALRKAVPFLELRTSPTSIDYLEGVLSRQDLSRCCAQLRDALGPPAKEFDQPATFDPQMQKTVQALGGIRIDQCLFLAQQEASQGIYAALWPWASDPTRVTLKVGVYRR